MVMLSSGYPCFDVIDYGATGDGTTKDTQAIQGAIDACCGAGGGTVVLPAGSYHCGSIFMKDRVELRLESGAVILGSEDRQDYPIVEARWEGRTQLTHAPLIAAQDATHISITGRGTVNGRGAVWWKWFMDRTLDYPRPRCLGFTNCENVLIEGITLTQSASWTVNPVRCRNVRITGITIINPPDGPNTDGINPDSCSQVRISDCYVSVGDDCITIKSGVESERPEWLVPCTDITITNCVLERGHGGVVIGSEMSGGVRNVAISNCIFNGTDRGIRIKSRRGRGGAVEDVLVSNVFMTDVTCPIVMNLYYNCGGSEGDATVSDKGARPADQGTPVIRRIRLSDIVARRVKYAAAFVYGLREMPIEDVVFSNVSIALDPDTTEAGHADFADNLPSMNRAGLFMRNAKAVVLDRVTVEHAKGPAFDIAEASDIEVAACSSRHADPDAPWFAMQNIKGAFVHGCRGGAGEFMRLTGADCADLDWSANAAGLTVRIGSDVPGGAVAGC